MNTRGLLVVIAVILLGILGVVMIEAGQDSPAEQMADDFGDLTEDVGDEIDN